jgi:uncharacterized protein (DUF427 family)
VVTEADPMDSDQPPTLEPTGKRIRAMANGRTVADTLAAVLLREPGGFPIWYFPPEDVRMDLLERGARRDERPFLGVPQTWTLKAGGRRVDEAAWSYDAPRHESLRAVAGRIAFDWDRVDHWFEEDEEVFGHARDPRHRVDVRFSSRQVRVVFAGEEVASTRRGLFLFETDLPPRYYIPPQDVRAEFLVPSRKSSICPYKGWAAYCSLAVGERRSEDAVWFYPDPLPEQPRIKGFFCFYPDKVDRLEVEGVQG